MLHDLHSLFPPSRCSTRLIDRIAVSHDASFYSLIPKVIVKPLSVSEIQSLFRISQSHKIPLTFRAAGTSLSGQAVSDGILADIASGWKRIEIDTDAGTVTVEPGIIGHHVNLRLKSAGRKIGPDPASIQSAMMGGILANNASGMCCGVIHNAYHTLVSLKAVLPDGTLFDSAQPEFHPLFPELLSIRNEILSNPALKEKIRTKYQIKNTIGYSLNSFLDFASPSEILARLLIGSEGTLGFISEATLRTLPDHPFKLTALFLFPDSGSACRQVTNLERSGASAIELMDFRSLVCIQPYAGPFAGYLANLPEGTTALLTEWESETTESLLCIEEKVRTLMTTFSLVHPPLLMHQPDDRSSLWKLRKGLFPTVGSARKSGTTVIIEDVAVPLPFLAETVSELELLFRKHDYPEAILFGHAKDGNLHFVITQAFDSDEQIRQYENLMADVVDLVHGRFGGSLKAEHGTGRNMAPFVETEWGIEAYSIMKRIKKLLDPANLLNPDVLISSDPNIHLKNLKTIHPADSESDSCMECGFCEPVCPSRDLTLSPRQRIVVRRAIAGGSEELKTLLSADFNYSGIDTCAADGLCATACPVGIDTGKVMKRLRTESASTTGKKMAGFLAGKFKLAEIGIRSVLFLKPLVKLSATAANFYFPKTLPELPSALNPTFALKPAPDLQAEAVYFQTCVSRTMGGYPDSPSLPETIKTVCERAGIHLSIPDVAGLCCGTPFQSKGYPEAATEVFSETIRQLFNQTDSGRIPVVVDTSPCTYTFLHPDFQLSEETTTLYSALAFVDSVTFLAKTVLPRLKVGEKYPSAWFHPVCSVIKMGILPDLSEIARLTTVDGRIPEPSGCCGMAGDRGMWFPELPEQAQKNEKEQFSIHPAKGYFSSSRTCESGLSEHTRFPFKSVWHLAEEVSR